MTKSTNSIKQIDNCNAHDIPEQVLSSTEPLLLKGLVKHWPVVKAFSESVNKGVDYVGKYDRDLPVTVYHSGAENKGRVFYNEDFTDFNFERARLTIKKVMEKLLLLSNDEQAATYYIGSTMVDHWLPGFRQENDINLDDKEALISIWLGNKSNIAAHYDFPNNIACTVAGSRRFTLFPPEQIDNLYVGPIDFTPSGQAISLVDSCNPDYEAFPKYKQALAASFEAELEAGDALFIPSMWWHHVEALESFNVLVNYWWRSTPLYQGAPANALQHALMSMKELPVEQRRVWKRIFDLYVFNEDEHAFDHIPEHARGVLSGVDEATARAIKTNLLKFLK